MRAWCGDLPNMSRSGLGPNWTAGVHLARLEARWQSTPTPGRAEWVPLGAQQLLQHEGLAHLQALSPWDPLGPAQVQHVPHQETYARRQDGALGPPAGGSALSMQIMYLSLSNVLP